MSETLPAGYQWRYGQLYGDYCLAVADSYQKLVQFGISSEEFREAKARAEGLKVQVDALIRRHGV